MGDLIPIEVTPSTSVDIDAALVADGLGLEVRRFRELMQQGKVSVLCERGVGEDKGRYRASFYHEGKRVRLTVDGDGIPV